MKRRVEGPRRWRVGMLASIACLGAVLAVVAGQGSAGAASNKPFAVVICPTATDLTCAPGTPPVVSPGATTSNPASVTAVITDETSTGAGLTIGSVNLTVPLGPTPPSGITIASASIPGMPTIGTCTSTTLATTSCISQDGTVLELRGLNVPPGGSLDVSIGLATPAPPTSCTPPPTLGAPAPCVWTATAKQSNNYNGPPGNQLNLDPNTSQLGIVLSAEATCLSAKKANTCSATLADGGATGSPGGSVSFTTTASGTSSGIFYQSLDYGAPLDSSPTGPCRGVASHHDEYINGPALEGSSARSFTVTIITTDYQGYDADVCAGLSMPFQAKTTSVSSGVTATLYTTTQLFPEPDGSLDYEGLLPDCAGSPGATAPTVNCKSLPGITSRSTVGNVHTIVASIPAGFDSSWLRN